MKTVENLSCNLKFRANDHEDVFYFCLTEQSI